MQVSRIGEPGYQGPGLPGVPAPIASPGGFEGIGDRDKEDFHTSLYTITGQFLVILTRFFATEPKEYLEFFKIFLLCVFGGYLHLVAAGGRGCPQVSSSPQGSTAI